MNRSARRLVYITAIVGVLFVVASAGAMGVAAQAPDGDRDINQTELDPGETTEVELTIDTTDQDELIIYEDIPADLEITRDDFSHSPVPETWNLSDQNEMISVWDFDNEVAETTVDYDITVPEDAEDGDFYSFSGDTTFGADDTNEFSGDDLITVGDADLDEVVVDITTPEYVEQGETYEAGVQVYNPTDSPVSGDLVYTADGEDIFTIADTVDPGESKTFPDDADNELNAPDELAGEVHTVEFEEFSDSQGVYSGVPEQSLGDVSNTGEVTIFDAVAIQRESLGLDPLESNIDTFDITAADVTRQGGIEIFDAVLAQRLSLGLDDDGMANVTDVEVTEGVSGDDPVSPGETITVSATVANDGSAGIFAGAEARFGDTAADGTLVGATTVDVDGEIGGSDAETTVTVEFTVPDVDPGTYEYGIFVDEDSETAEIEVDD